MHPQYVVCTHKFRWLWCMHSQPMYSILLPLQYANAGLVFRICFYFGYMDPETFLKLGGKTFPPKNCCPLIFGFRGQLINLKGQKLYAGQKTCVLVSKMSLMINIWGGEQNTWLAPGVKSWGGSFPPCPLVAGCMFGYQLKSLFVWNTLCNILYRPDP